MHNQKFYVESQSFYREEKFSKFNIYIFYILYA